MTRTTLACLAIAGAVLAGCGSVPVPSARLEQARFDVSGAQHDPATRDLAPAELRAAGAAMALADAAYERHGTTDEVDPLALLASQRATLARQTGRLRAAEAMAAQR
jgi:hypothetical protein